ncbi:Alpha/beta hydrolase fold-1 [Halenospora varia]|nr:Alpha/beta hydrolase fold-1 [Halenospora varia]
MASDKPSIVLLHGGWHTPKTYSKLTTALNMAGYQVYTPQLPSISNERPPKSDLTTDTAFVRDYVTNLADLGETLIVLMHSYGGQVGTNSLYGLGINERAKEGKQGGVAQLIYMCAFALTEGKSMVDKINEFGHGDLIPVHFIWADDMTVTAPDLKTTMIGASVSDAEAEAYLSTLVGWNGNDWYQGLEHCAWREIPVTYIHGTQDITTPYVYQQSMVEKMREEGRHVEVVELETGHLPHLTMTREVVAVVEKVVARTIVRKY